MKIKISIYSMLIVASFSIKSFAQTKQISTAAKPNKGIAVFAEGCFWCSEHVFESVVGVESAISGYTGGSTKNPSYEQVGSEKTNHAEAVLVNYDPKKISYSQLLNIFFASHNPTTPNQQGPDKGTSYRSIAFYQNASEKKAIVDKINELNSNKTFANPIVTEIKPIAPFYKAEDYHQNYIDQHPENLYVQSVSIPRFNKFKKTYKGKLKY